ncbi:MAG TPA: response regulator, partial [Thermoanaerobaculia bacterium]|nr:response regulator [Thermoanaerobaculia bacterium]
LDCTGRQPGAASASPVRKLLMANNLLHRASRMEREVTTEGTGVRVLVADDDVMIRKLIVRALEREKFVLDEAKDGAETIEKCSQDGYSVILLDMMMPRIDGAGVLDWMRENKPELLKRVVVMTAFTRVAAESVERRCPVIYKPFDLTDLIAAVRDRADFAAAC